MGFKCTCQTNQEESLCEFFTIDKKLAYFCKRDNGIICAELKHHRITNKMQSMIDKINQKLDSITDVCNFKYDDDDDEVIFPILNRLDYALRCIDQENKCEVPTSHCVPVYLPLTNIAENFILNMINALRGFFYVARNSFISFMIENYLINK